MSSARANVCFSVNIFCFLFGTLSSELLMGVHWEGFCQIKMGGDSEAWFLFPRGLSKQQRTGVREEMFTSWHSVSVFLCFIENICPKTEDVLFCGHLLVSASC